MFGGGGPDTRYKDVNRFENSLHVAHLAQVLRDS